jgi:hypothetical protein
LPDKWERARAQRDDALVKYHQEDKKVLDMGCELKAGKWSDECPHGMKRHLSSFNWNCDVCKKSKSYRTHMRCDCCDFDVCDECIHAGRHRRGIQGLVEALATLETHHAEMRAVEKEMAGSTANGQDNQLFEQLARLRHQRVRRPRIVSHHSVSNRTGQGLRYLRGTLEALMEDERLFPHVGMQVPLNYSMLERLAQEGRLQSKDDEGEAPTQTQSDRAEWEKAVTRHVAAKCMPGSPHSQSCIRTRTLKERPQALRQAKALRQVSKQSRPRTWRGTCGHGRRASSQEGPR